MDIHEAITLIKKFQFEHNRTPTWDEALSIGITGYLLRKSGGINKLITMAGLEPERKSRVITKITNDIFRKDIDSHLDEYSSAPFNSDKVKSKILIAGDTHFCWDHGHTLEAFYAFNKEVQPDYVVQVGDLYDMYAHSKFPRSQNIYTPKDEERLSREAAERFFTRISKDNPKAIIYNMFGNHDIRPAKRTIESMPQMEHFVERYLEELMTFEGVNLVKDHREILTIEGVGFHHGYLGKLGDHRDAALQNMVVGHTHRGGVSYRRVRNETLWELNAGFMGDPEAKVMSYTASKIQNYTLGFGYIDKYGPRFIHQ